MLHLAKDFGKYNSFYGPADNRQVVYALHKGVCCGCGTPVSPGQFHVGHIIAQKEAAEFEARFPGLDVHNLLNLHLLCRDCNLGTNEHVMISEFMLQRVYSENARIITSRILGAIRETRRVVAADPKLLEATAGAPTTVSQRKSIRKSAATAAPILVEGSVGDRFSKELRSKVEQAGALFNEDALIQFPPVTLSVSAFPSPEFTVSAGGVEYAIIGERQLYQSLEPQLLPQLWFNGGAYRSWVSNLRRQFANGDAWVRVDGNSGKLTNTCYIGPGATEVQQQIRARLGSEIILDNWLAIPQLATLPDAEYQYSCTTFEDMAEWAESVRQTAVILATGLVSGPFIAAKTRIMRHGFGRYDELAGGDAAHSIFIHGWRNERSNEFKWGDIQARDAARIPKSLADLVWSDYTVYKIEEIVALNRYLAHRYPVLKAAIYGLLSRRKKVTSGLRSIFFRNQALAEELDQIPLPDVFKNAKPIPAKFKKQQSEYSSRTEAALLATVAAPPCSPTRLASASASAPAQHPYHLRRKYGGGY